MKVKDINGKYHDFKIKKKDAFNYAQALFNMDYALQEEVDNCEVDTFIFNDSSSFRGGFMHIYLDVSTRKVKEVRVNYQAYDGLTYEFKVFTRKVR